MENASTILSLVSTKVDSILDFSNLSISLYISFSLLLFVARKYFPSVTYLSTISPQLLSAHEIKNKEIVDALELPPIKIHCSVLAEDSIKQAIEDYESKQ